MQGSEYIRKVFSEIAMAKNFGLSPYEDAFVRAVLEVSRDVESPLKEEAIVRLVAMRAAPARAARRQRRRLA